MSDWRNWKAGDLVECKSVCAGQFTNGKIYQVRGLGTHNVEVIKDDRGSTSNGWGYKNFTWHSRPSA